MKHYLKVCLIIFASSLLAPPVWADTGHRPSFSHRVLTEQYAAAPVPRINADEAAAQVQRQYGGRIISVETRQRNGSAFYRIKILTRKGVVRVVRINAGSRQ